MQALLHDASTDAAKVTKLFLERLQAWKHACGYLEDYIGATEKMQHAHAKEYEKVLKVHSHGHRSFDYSPSLLTIYQDRLPSLKGGPSL